MNRRRSFGSRGGGRRPVSYGPRSGGRRGGCGRLVVGLIIASFSIVSYCASKEYNPVTGETQYIAMTPRQEIALGLQAAPEMARQHGGLHPDRNAQQLVDNVGQRIVGRSDAGETQWQFEFHLLADEQMVNAFALPGGQIFITAALFQRLETEGQLAGVLGHEVGHVVGRHSAQRMAQSKLTNGLTGAVAVASGDARAATVAAAISQMVNMKHGRGDELQSDELGVRFLAQAGYDPRSLIRVMEILAESRPSGGPPEFFSTHPNPDNRIGRIQDAIREVYPNGVPEGLIR
ncbi:MAG: M48 family metalloprotease [Acidobacteriota bacterium]